MSNGTAVCRMSTESGRYMGMPGGQILKIGHPMPPPPPRRLDGAFICGDT
jgi:hypothetical protein